MRLIKNGDYTQVKNICHYSPSWDPNDSIFNKNVRFIHAYLNKYGIPDRSEFKNGKNITGDHIAKIYLSKVSLMDTTLDTAYVELDYYNFARGLPDSSIKEAILKKTLKSIPTQPENFYLIRIKKDDNYKIQ